MITRVWPQLCGQLDGCVAVGRFADYDIGVLTRLLKHLLEVQPDQRLVFGDNHAVGSLAHPLKPIHSRYIEQMHGAPR